MAASSLGTEINNDEKAPPDIRRKRSFTLQLKRVSDEMQLEFIELFDSNPIDFRKRTAAMLRENPNLFNMNEIGTVADEQNQVTLETFQQFLSGILKPQLSQYIYQCIDDEKHNNTVSLTAITRFLSGRSKVARRAKTIIDEDWLIRRLKDVDIGTIDESGTNMIELSEFKNFFANLKKEVPEDLVLELFDEIDTNGDGKISSFEYFKWKEGFKAGKTLNQHLPATIKKSSTKLKLLNTGSKIPYEKSGHVRFTDTKRNSNAYDDSDSEEDELQKLKAQILKLQKANQDKDNIINDRNVEIDRLKLENDKHLQLINNNNKLQDKYIKAISTERDELQSEMKENNEIRNKLQGENEMNKEKINDLNTKLNDNKIASNENIIGLERKINELQTVINQSQESGKENNKLTAELQTKIKNGNAKIEAYESKIKELKSERKQQVDENANLKKDLNGLQNKYELISVSNSKLKDNDVKMDGDDEVAKLKKLLAENEAELMLMEKDKENLFQQLEETYGIVNEELVGNRKVSKHSKKHKIKTIDDGTELRKQLKKLKSKIDVKDEKIKKYKSERALIVNNNEKVVEQPKKEESPGQFQLKNLFVFLKDF